MDCGGLLRVREGSVDQRTSDNLPHLWTEDGTSAASSIVDGLRNVVRRSQVRSVRKLSYNVGNPPAPAAIESDTRWSFGGLSVLLRYRYKAI